MKEMWLKFMESDGESYISRVRSTCPQVLIQPREEDIDPING